MNTASMKPVNLHFIEEKSNSDKLKALGGTIALVLALLLLGGLFAYSWYGLKESVPGAEGFYDVLAEDIRAATPWTLFYVEFFAGLFFVPSPDEIIYFYALSRQNSILLCFIAVNLGYFLAQVLNYFIGLKLSRPIMHLVSKPKLYAARRWSSKYGSVGIFLANLIPFLPSPLMTFGLGLTHYNFTRLMIWAMAGRILKYGIVTVVFIGLT